MNWLAPSSFPARSQRIVAEAGKEACEKEQGSRGVLDGGCTQVAEPADTIEDVGGREGEACGVAGLNVPPYSKGVETPERHSFILSAYKAEVVAEE